MNRLLSHRFDRWFRGTSLAIFAALGAVQIVGADALFGSLITRGFVPKDLTFVGLAAPALNVVHMLIYGGVALSFATLVLHGTRAWHAGLYIAVPTALQVIYNGCMLTDVQNVLWVAQGIAPIENAFIFDAFVPLPQAITKAFVFAVALFYSAPALARLILWAQARYGETVMVPRMPLDT